jgi:hypothetical protein
VAVLDAEQEQLVVTRLDGLAKFYLEARPDLRERAKEILLYLVKEGVISSETARTGSEIARKFADKFPTTSVGRTLSILERYGFLDRRTKYDGYFVSHKFLNEMERHRAAWKKVLDIADTVRRS